jgi:hypothetical protein
MLGSGGEGFNALMPDVLKRLPVQRVACAKGSEIGGFVSGRGWNEIYRGKIKTAD